MKTNILMATVLSIGLFAACKPNNPPVTERQPSQEELQLIGEWKRVNIEVQGNIESAQGTLKLDTSKFKILPENKIEITNDKQPVIILPDGTEFTKNTTEFEYRVIAKSYLLLTNAEGEISTFKRMEEYPAMENKNKSFTGTWRFVKYTDMKSGETITAADLNSTSHYLEFTPFS